MAFKQPKPRGRPTQKYIYRNLDSYGNIFPKDTSFHKYDKINRRIILKKKE